MIRQVAYQIWQNMLRCISNATQPQPKDKHDDLADYRITKHVKGIMVMPAITNLAVIWQWLTFKEAVKHK